MTKESRRYIFAVSSRNNEYNLSKINLSRTTEYIFRTLQSVKGNAISFTDV